MQEPGWVQLRRAAHAKVTRLRDQEIKKCEKECTGWYTDDCKQRCRLTPFFPSENRDEL